MAYVFVNISPSQIGAVEENYLQEEEERYAADVQKIVDNANKEAAGYEVAEMQEEQAMEVPTTPLNSNNTAYFIAAGISTILLIALLAKKK